MSTERSTCSTNSAPKRDAPAPPKTPPLVVMAVGNAAVGDSRVEKTALTARNAGYDVLILGVKNKTVHTLGTYDGIPIYRPTPDWSGYNIWRETTRVSTETTEDQIEDTIRNIDNSIADSSKTLTAISATISEFPKLIAPMRLNRGPTLDLSWAEPAVKRFGQLRRNLVRPKENWKHRNLWLSSLIPGAWRNLWPQITAYEQLFLEAFRELQPDIVHAHDRHPMSAAARYAEETKAGPRPARWVYDAHEYLPGQRFSGPARHRIAWIAMERELIPQADAVVTVSPHLANALQRRHSLPATPAIVANAPNRIKRLNIDDNRQSLRAEIGIDSEVPLLVYVGKLAERRGVYTIVEALQHLPGAHAAFVASADKLPRQIIRSRSLELGVSDRVHIVDYVPSENVTSYISSATIGMSPLYETPAHHLALPTKIREYIQAGLPIVGTDLQDQGRFIVKNGIGAVHRERDVRDLARAVKAVLSEPASFRQNITEALKNHHCWEANESTLLELWSRLHPHTTGPREEEPEAARAVPAPPLTDRQHQLIAGNSINKRRSILNRGGVLLFKNCDSEIWHELRIPETGLKEQLRTWSIITNTPGTLFLESFDRFLPKSLCPEDANIAAFQSSGLKVLYDVPPGHLEDPFEALDTKPHSHWSDVPEEANDRTVRRRRRLRTLLDRWNISVSSTQPGFDLLGPRRYWIPHTANGQTHETAISEKTARLPNNMVGILNENRSSYEANMIRAAATIAGANIQEVSDEADFKNCSLVIGSLTNGWYSENVVDALVRGIPVIAHVQNNVRGSLPASVPIIEATASSIHDVLKQSLASPEKLHMASTDSRVFANTLHTDRAVSKYLACATTT